MSFGSGKLPPQRAVPPPPNTPTQADATTYVAGSDISKPLVSDRTLISTSPLGLQRKANVEKRRLIGG